MTKTKKRVLASVIAALIVIGSFADVLNFFDFRIFAAGEYNYIANNGDDALNTVSVQPGGANYVETHMITESLPYGKAFSFFPKAEDAHNYFTIAELPLKAEWKISKTHGIAFYVKLSEVTVSTLRVALRIGGTDSYSVTTSDTDIGYMAHNGGEVIWQSLSEQGGVLSGKSGYEGFVFLPYSAFRKDGVSLTAQSVADAASVQLMLATASTAVSDYNKDWIFDEIGFYENAGSYVRGVGVEYGTEYIANSGDNAGETVKLAWNCKDGQITFSQLDNPLSRYGKAIGLTVGDTESGWNNYKTGIVINPESHWDISATEGYAFYCELPDVGADTAMDIWWYINDDCFWNELQPGKPVFYVENGSDKIEKTVFSWDDYSLPGHDRGGFKGFIFVPFSSLKTKYNGQDRKYINEASYFEMRVGIARRPDQASELANQTFVFDEIGLYTEPLAYIEAAKAKSDIGEYEIIANDGTDAANTVKLPAGYDGVTVSQEPAGVSAYGAAIGVTTASSGWNMNKTGIVLDAGKKDISMTNGIAFYVKAPDVGELDPALDLWLWNTDRYCWNELVPGSHIYYIEKGSTTVTSVEFQWSDYSLPLHSKSGFEGFVFIPYEAFKCTWSDNQGKDIEMIRGMDRFEMRFNVARTDSGLADRTFVFDELGFYRDPLAYAARAEAHRETPKQANSIANNCSNVSETVTVPNTLKGKTTVSQLESGITPYGEAMKMTLGDSGWNADKIRIKMPVENEFDMQSAKGFAFYVKAPAVDSGTDPCLDLLFYKNDSEFWNELEQGKPIYYLAKDSDTLTSEVFSWGDYSLPLSKRAGFEGFIFIPFDSLKTKYNGSDRELINSVKTPELWLCPARTAENAPNLAEKSYVFDDFGFYSDELAYAAYCLKNDGAAVKGLEYLSNTAVDGTKARICGTTDSITLTQIDNAVNMGMAYTVYPEKAGSNNFWAEFDLPAGDELDITRTAGIAFYAKLPKNTGRGMQAMIYLDDGHYYNDPVKGGNFYYVAKGTDTVEKITNNGSDYPFKGKSDWEGWFFLPYNALQKNGNTASAASVAAAKNVSLRISIISDDITDYSKNYIIDELGYFSNPLSYIKKVKALYVDKSANYIANDGSSAADTVIAQWDMTNQIRIEQSDLGASPYGASISMTNSSSRWNLYKTGFVLNVDREWDISATNGIAFYLKVPQSDADPALDSLLFINNTDYWYDKTGDAKVYYLADGSDTITEDYATNLIAHNMQGFSGFVFVPFDSFKGMSGKRGIINNAARFEWRINTAQVDKSLLNKTYVFDELGFYSDPIAYAEKARELHGAYEYVANNASDSATFFAEPGYEEYLRVEQVSKGQPFSNAISVTPLKSGFESAGAAIILKREPAYNISMTNGFAFYANVPKGADAGGISLEVSAGGRSYSGAASGKKIYYLEKNSSTLVSSDAADGILNGKAGFCGFVFVPFDSVKGLDRGITDNADQWQITLRFKADEKAINKSYIFDEIGFYRDPFSYAKPIKDTDANYIAESFDDLSSVTATKTGTEVRLVSGRTPFGTAVSIVPTKVRSDNTWDHINIVNDPSAKLQNTEGIAMYVRMPGGISESQVTVMLYLDDSKFYPNNTGPVYYIPKNSDGSVIGVSSRQTLYDKVAFEGWVFIPYSSLTAHDGGKIDPNELQSRGSFQIRISHYRMNEDELGRDFIFDEIGFYSDKLSYIETVYKKYNITKTENDGNYVANHGDDADLTTVMRDGNNYTSVEIDGRSSPYGDAIAITDTSAVTEWHSLRLGAVLDTDSGSAAEKAEGIAFYACFPDKVESTHFNLTLYADEYHAYTLSSGHFEDETPYTADYVTVDKNGNRKKVSAADALENLRGFEGYIFVPYTSLRDTADATVTAADNINYIANSRSEIRFTKEYSDGNAYNRCFVIDELGFYRTEEEYIRLVKNCKHDQSGNTSGNIIFNSCSSAEDFRSVNDMAVAVRIVEDKTSTGMSAEVISRIANDTVNSVMLNMNLGSFVIKKAKGVSFYIDAPSAATVTFIIRVNDALSYRAEKTVEASFRGLVFIPFEAFTGDPAGMTSNLDLSHGVTAEIIQTVQNPGVNSAFIYDSIGFYSSEDGYKNLVENSFDEGNDSLGNYPYILKELNISTGGNAVTRKNDSSPTGIEVLDITANSSSTQSVSFEITRKNGELWQLSTGISFFADLSSGAVIDSVSLGVNDNVYSLSTGSFTYLSLNDEYGTPVNSGKISELSGKTVFVFIPFTSLEPAVALSGLANAENAVITFEIGGNNKTAAIGGPGFYGGTRQYICAMRKAMGYGDYILNDGEQISSWKIEDSGMYSVSVTGKSPNGTAVALIPETAGTDHNASVLLKKDKNTEKTLGIAFYANLPAGVSGTDIGIRLKIREDEYFEFIPDAPVYYAQSSGSPVFTVRARNILQNRQGTKSYVFIPFDSMRRVYTADGKTVSETLNATASKYFENTEEPELVINNRRSSDRDTHYEYIFDTLGLYSNIESYLEKAAAGATVKYVTSAGYAPGRNDSAEAELHIVNALNDSSDVSVAGGKASRILLNGSGAVAVTPSSAFSISFANELFGSEEAKYANGIMFWLETPEGVSDPALTVTLTDKRGNKYVFDGGNYYFNSPEESGSTVPMKGRLSLGGFKGNVILPLESFSDGQNLSFIDIKEVTVSGVDSFKNKSIALQSAYAYPSLDFLRMSLGDLADRYTVSSDGNDSVAVSKDVIRIHSVNMTYNDIIGHLKISPSLYSLSLPNGVNGGSKATGSFTVDILRKGIKIGSINIEIVTDDIVTDTVIIIKPEVPEIPEKEVTVSNRVLVEEEIFSDEENKNAAELISVKTAAKNLVRLEGDTVIITSVMSADRLKSAFVTAEGVKLYIADEESYIVNGNAGVYNNYYLVVEYDGVKTGFKISAPGKPAAEVGNFNLMRIIIPSASAVFVLALVLIIVFIRKKKKTA